jgi:phenazine biosynthesis protein phzE
VLVVDAEDAFTQMLGHQLRALGMTVTIRRFDEVCLSSELDRSGQDLVVVGPGPGDPRIHDDPKIARLRALTEQLLTDRIPVFAVCLGHQVLSSLLGLDVVRLDIPNQGVQRTIDLFGRPERVGFYNTFTAQAAADRVHCLGAPGLVEVSRDPMTGNVHALRGRGFASVQFHPESLLTQNGVDLVAALLMELLAVVVAA